MRFHEALAVNSLWVKLKEDTMARSGTIILSGTYPSESLKMIFYSADYIDDALWDSVPIVTNGYGDDQFFKVIKRDELEEDAEIKRINDQWSYDSGWMDLMPKRGCDHKWKETQGIYKVYKDCTKCNKKFEDVYPENK